MKTLCININNEQIQSNEELEVLNYDLDSDFFFYLGEKVAKNCKVENENALITDFNTQDNAEDYQKIIAQWHELKTILFSEKCEGEFKFTLPNGYIHWLRYSEKYNTVYDRNFSHGEQAVIIIDLEELHEDSVEDLQRKIIRKLQCDDLYFEIDEIVFNDEAVTRKSPIVRTIKEKYEGVGFKAYKKWLDGNKQQEDNNIPDIGIPNTEEEDYSSDDLTLLVNWIYDAFKEETAIDCRKDATMRDKVYEIVKTALDECKSSQWNRGVDIWIPYVWKYDSKGRPKSMTNFKRTLSKGLLHSLKSPNGVENKSWGWEFLRSLDGDVNLKRHNYKYGLVDYDGIIIAQCEYDEITPLKSGNFRLLKGGKFGLINRDKTINIPCIYDELYDCDDNLFKVKIEGRYYKIDDKGMKKYVKQEGLWLYANSDGSIDQDLKHIISPIGNVVLGQTTISILDKYVKLYTIRAVTGQEEDGCVYKFNNRDINFIQLSKDNVITKVMISSSEAEYDKVKTSVHNLGCELISSKDGKFLYQTPDKLFKILILKEYIVVEYYNTVLKIIEVLYM